VEKFLNAFLLSRNWELQRIHDLEVLLNAAVRHDPALETFRAVCQRITGYYLIERYPLITESGLKNHDLTESLAQVMPLVERLRSATVV
jgi:HEPN domain-containing protein